jgi:hypothetical protein
MRNHMQIIVKAPVFRHERHSACELAQPFDDAMMRRTVTIDAITSGHATSPKSCLRRNKWHVAARLAVKLQTKFLTQSVVSTPPGRADRSGH